MILPGLLGGYLTLFIAGLGLALLLTRHVARLNTIEICCLAWIFGVGIVSLLLWIFGRIASGPVLTILVLVCCLALGVAGWLASRHATSKFYMPMPAAHWEWIAIALLAFQIGIVFWVSIVRTLGWDGLLVWEAKARFAFLSHNVLPDYYYRSGRWLTHPEYPLGIPLTELWLYIWMGQAHQFWVKTLFPIFYAVAVVLLVIVGTRLSGKRAIGYVAAFLFFFVPHETVSNGSSSVGYADFPLSLIYFVAIAYLLLALRNDTPYAFRVYIAALPLLPWFKREGAILWLIAAVIGASAALIKRKGRLLPAILLPGATVIFGWAFYLRSVHVDAPQEFLISWTLFCDNAYRLIPTWYAIIRNMSDPKLWSVFWLLAAVAVICLATRVRKLESAVLLWAAVFPLLAYSSIYIFSTAPVYVLHINLSLSRLLMQVVPVFWLVIVAAVAAPWHEKKSVQTATP